MKILVTGGTGYIGSHTAVELLEAGFEVYIVDNLSNSNIEVLKGIEKITNKTPYFQKIDLADEQASKTFFEKHHDFDGIIHFAAFKSVGESTQKPLKYYHNNINSLLNVLNAIKKYNINNFVFSSSCTVYGQADELPVTEKSPIKKADSPYGNTKQIAEDIIRATIKAHAGLNAIALRYFNPIGAHPSALIGELPLGKPDNLVPFITQTAAGIRDELLIFGKDYNTPDGTAIRDYIHVMDLAKAHLITLERLIQKQNKSNFEVFNIGSGKGSSVKEITDTFIKVTGVNLKHRYTDRRPGDIEQVWADTSLSNKELNWKCNYSLADALKSAWEWEKHIRKI